MRTTLGLSLALGFAVACGSTAANSGGTPADTATSADTAVGDGSPGDAAKVDTATSDTSGTDADTASSSGDWVCPTAAEPACGGELEGTTWTVVEFCPEDPTAAAAMFQHPFDNLPPCQPPGGTVAGKLTHTGSLHFENGQVQIQLTTNAVTTYTFSDACLAAAKPEASAPSAACASLAKPDIMACTYTAGTPGGDVCTCNATVPGDSSKGSEPYSTVAGHTLMIGGEMQADYCVKGDRLLMDITPHIKSWRWWLLERQK